jgi:hypothetical protein
VARHHAIERWLGLCSFPAFMGAFSRGVARRGICALLVSLVGACAEPQTQSLSAELSAVQTGEARLAGMLRRSVSRAPEISALLAELLAVAERTARIGLSRGRHGDVADLAKQTLVELKAARESFDRNCTKKHSESAPWERAALRGQQIVTNLRFAADAEFDRSYLHSVAQLGAEFAELLDTSVEARGAQGEARELTRLRDLLLAQEERAEALLDSLH